MWYFLSLLIMLIVCGPSSSVDYHAPFDQSLILELPQQLCLLLLHVLPGFAHALKVLEFQNKNSRPWKSLKIVVGAGKYLKFVSNFMQRSFSSLLDKNRRTLYFEHLMWHYICLILPLLESLKNGKMCPWKALKSPWIFVRKRYTKPVLHARAAGASRDDNWRPLQTLLKLLANSIQHWRCEWTIFAQWKQSLKKSFIQCCMVQHVGCCFWQSLDVNTVTQHCVQRHPLCCGQQCWMLSANNVARAWTGLICYILANLKMSENQMEGIVM